MRNKTVISEVESYKDKLYRFALKILGNSFDAEDVYQELMIKIWKKREEFRLLDNQEAWCMTVIRNLAIDKIRRSKNSTQDIDNQWNLSDNTPTPDTVAEDKEQLSIVMQLLGSLPENQKEIIHLRDVEGYSYKEIATILEMSEDQVKVNLYRARQKFKEVLVKHNFQR